MKKYVGISDISFLNSMVDSRDSVLQLYKEGYFSDETKWEEFDLLDKIDNLTGVIKSRLKNRMSLLSLGVYNVLENGPGVNLGEDEEICLFTGFGEIETTNKIIKSIILDKFRLVSPTLFHNSVHHTSLGYYTIINKKHNPCLTISDGLSTGLSFINYMRLREKMGKKITVVAGEENSAFFKLDKTKNLKIKPSFSAYRFTPDCDSGIRFGGSVDSYQELVKLDIFKASRTVFTDKNVFFEIRRFADKEIVSEYPLLMDNPCGIVYRLALPFYLDIKGDSVVIEKINDKIYFFEVKN